MKYICHVNDIPELKRLRELQLKKQSEFLEQYRWLENRMKDLKKGMNKDANALWDEIQNTLIDLGKLEKIDVVGDKGVFITYEGQIFLMSASEVTKEMADEQINKYDFERG